MKKIVLLAGMALSLGIGIKSDAQVRINVNIVSPMPVMQQSWYGSDCDYYYMPDQGVYYNVNRRMYIWPNGGNWMCGPALPRSYGACTWGNSRYYSFRGRSPFMRHDYYRNHYGWNGRGGGYAYRNDGRRDSRFENRGGGRRWGNDRGGNRTWDNDRGGNRNWDNGRGGRGDDRNWDNDRDGRGNNGNNGNNGGYNGRGGWDRR